MVKRRSTCVFCALLAFCIVIMITSSGPGYNRKDMYCAPDNTWVPVMRTGCIPWSEGRYAFPNDGLTPYGCWFWKLNSSQILINVGRSLCLDRTDMWFQMETRLYPNRSIEKVLLGADGLDRGWCHHALILGYDTLQVLHSYDDKAEVVVCNHGCDTDVVHSGCPPSNVTLRDARTNKVCICDNTSLDLNCGQSYDMRHRCR